MKFFAALPPCLVGMEACATSHYWARELTRLGHQVRLMPAKDVKAYVKRNKNDAADAEAICEAVRRPTIRFVGAKSAEQQGRLMQHRTRDLLIRQRTQTINALRAHMAELGIVAAQGREGLKQLLAIIADEKDARLPIDARASLIVLAAQLQALQTMIGSIERRLLVQHRANEASKRLESIPGIGTIGASASVLRRARQSPLPPRSQTRMPSGRGVILPPGLGSYRDKIQPGANRSLARSRNRVTAICGAFLWSGRIPCCGGPRRPRRNIRGWRSSWRGDRSRSWPLRSPTRWRAWPGRCWPGVAAIEYLRSRQRKKRLSDGRMRLRPCVS